MARRPRLHAAAAERHAPPPRARQSAQRHERVQRASPSSSLPAAFRAARWNRSGARRRRRIDHLFRDDAARAAVPRARAECARSTRRPRAVRRRFGMPEGRLMDPHRVFLECGGSARKRRLIENIPHDRGAGMRSVPPIHQGREFSTACCTSHNARVSHVSLLDKVSRPRVRHKLTTRPREVSVQTACSTARRRLPRLRKPARLQLRHGARRRLSITFSPNARLSRQEGGMVARRHRSSTPGARHRLRSGVGIVCEAARRALAATGTRPGASNQPTARARRKLAAHRPSMGRPRSSNSRRRSRAERHVGYIEATAPRLGEPSKSPRSPKPSGRRRMRRATARSARPNRTSAISTVPRDHRLHQGCRHRAGRFRLTALRDAESKHRLRAQPFFVNTELRDWPRPRAPRAAARQRRCQRGNTVVSQEASALAGYQVATSAAVRSARLNARSKVTDNAAHLRANPANSPILLTRWCGAQFHPPAHVAEITPGTRQSNAHCREITRHRRLPASRLSILAGAQAPEWSRPLRPNRSLAFDRCDEAAPTSQQEPRILHSDGERRWWSDAVQPARSSSNTRWRSLDVVPPRAPSGRRRRIRGASSRASSLEDALALVARRAARQAAASAIPGCLGEEELLPNAAGPSIAAVNSPSIYACGSKTQSLEMQLYGRRRRTGSRARTFPQRDGRTRIAPFTAEVEKPTACAAHSFRFVRPAVDPADRDLAVLLAHFAGNRRLRMPQRSVTGNALRVGPSQDARTAVRQHPALASQPGSHPCRPSRPACCARRRPALPSVALKSYVAHRNAAARAVTHVSVPSAGATGSSRRR